jgi:hypothetical protein
LSAGTAAADPFDPYRGAGAGGSKAAVTGVAEEAAIARHSLSLIPSSVFVNGNSGTAAPSAAPRSSGIGSAALRTVQAGSSLTIYQALHTTATDPDAALPPNGTIEAYTLIPPTAATPGRASATMLRVPMKVTSSSYGFLNSSLTVFSDEFGSFAGIGQTFNGLTSLNIDEPPAIAIVGLGLLGLAAIRRCLKRS